MLKFLISRVFKMNLLTSVALTVAPILWKNRKQVLDALQKKKSSASRSRKF